MAGSLTPHYLTYDIETYPNVFTCVLINEQNNKRAVVEVSQRRNDWPRLRKLLLDKTSHRFTMVGFNNLGFDYPILHTLIQACPSDAPAKTIVGRAWLKCQAIINTPWSERFNHRIYPNQQFVKQLDLYAIHHFDNVARSTSLKELEFNMRATSIKDLPFPPGKRLTPSEIDTLIHYNAHDVEQTRSFFHISRDKVAFRRALSSTEGIDFTNHNDTKIGKDYMSRRLGIPGKITTSHREHIVLDNLILDSVKLRHPAFRAIEQWLRRQVVSNTKGTFTGIPEDALGDVAAFANLDKVKGKIKNLNVIIDGFQFDFGAGGLHGATPNTAFHADDEIVIEQRDVKSYYPNLAIVNDLHPEHLGKRFCEVYADVYKMRSTFAKGSAENAMLKLALNGVYGDSNSIYSPFYDPQYTLSITINGQLLLCMLAEALMSVPGLRLINVNTDGIAYSVPKVQLDKVNKACAEWEKHTRLILETDTYVSVWMRDVNNYLAVKTDGSITHKGVYEYDYEANDDWHKNFSARVVARAAEACLVRGQDIDSFIEHHPDDYDFFLRAKVPRGSRLVCRDVLTEDDEQALQNLTRYYVSTDGVSLIKIMPPLPKAPDKEREIGINKHQAVTVSNDSTVIDRATLNTRYYAQRVREITDIFECANVNDTSTRHCATA